MSGTRPVVKIITESLPQIYCTGPTKCDKGRKKKDIMLKNCLTLICYQNSAVSMNLFLMLYII
jgi:hypothetical protein